MLHDKQKEEMIWSANKLSDRHIRFDNVKMKVPYAVQVLSNSVATSLNLLHELNEPGFTTSSCTATSLFLRTFNS